MGLFDRLRSVGRAVANNGEPQANTSEQDATRLIEAGHVLEASNRLDEAMQCYLDAIRIAPNPARAYLNQGNVLLLKGDLQGALEAFRTAIKHKQDYAGAYYNIGNALQGDKHFDEAVVNYRRALEIQPNYAEVHCALGVALQNLGELDGAVASFQAALKFNPNITEARTNLGNVLRDLYTLGNVLLSQGKFDDAVVNYRKVLAIEPNLAEAHAQLGSALQDLGQMNSAIISYRRALEIQPDFVDAHGNLGNLLQAIGQFESAVSCYQKVLEFKPDSVEAHNNLGNVLQALGYFEDAVACYQRALEIKPDFAVTHCNLGNTLQELRQFVGAVASHRRALEIQPELAEAHSNLGSALKDLGRFDEAIASYRRALAIQPDFMDAYNNLLFSLHYTADHALSYCLEQARQFGQIVTGKVGSRFSAWQCVAQPERLRVGLVSGDFMSHPVGFFLEGLLAHIDPARIELIAYPTHHKEDELTARIRPHFSAWKPLFGKSDEAAAGLIHTDGVHVLIDLSGHTRHNRLPVFAWKPAPVQVSWLGYFATTGMEEIDYLLADAVGVPEDQQGQFTESVWYLPDTRLCFTAPNVAIPVASLPALSNGRITFGCFQNLSKVTDEVLVAWGAIFAALPGARLRMQCKQLGEPAQAVQQLQRLQHYGIDSARVTLHGSAPREAYLAAHAEVDIILDTFPYPGGTTTCEALWMGVPTLTLAGDRLLSRQGASLLMAAGLTEWVAMNREEYIAKAVALASDLTKLATLRADLRQQVLASPLFDAPRFAQNLEQALWEMWLRYCDSTAAKKQ